MTEEKYMRAARYCSKCGEQMRMKIVLTKRYNNYTGEQYKYLSLSCPRIIDSWFSFGHDSFIRNESDIDRLRITMDTDGMSIGSTGNE